MMFAHMRNRKPTKICERCGLKYEIDKQKCPHCHSLSDEQVKELKVTIEREHIGNRKLGKLFLIASITIAGLILLISIAE